MLLLPAGEMEKVRQQAESAYPTECCGLLIGLDGNERRVEEARPCLNAAPDMARVRYKIHPLALLETEKELLGSERMILGIYHSHPDYPTSPSQIDFEHAWPWYSYLILSVKRGHLEEAASWRLASDMSEFRREELRVLEAA